MLRHSHFLVCLGAVAGIRQTTPSTIFLLCLNFTILLSFFLLNLRLLWKYPYFSFRLGLVHGAILGPGLLLELPIVGDYYLQRRNPAILLIGLPHSIADKPLL